MTAILAVPGALRSDDFIRGDINGDGAVSIADVHFLNSFLFLGGAPPTCLDAGDFDDDGVLTHGEAGALFCYLVFGINPPPAPFPGTGTDPTTGDDLDCLAYGGGSAGEDPGAELMIAGAVSSPGMKGMAAITLAMSNSIRVRGYFIAIRDAGAVFEEAANAEIAACSPGTPTLFLKELKGLEGIRGPIDLGAQFLAGNVQDGILTAGMIASFTSPIFIPAGERDLLLEVRVPLKPGVSPGEYPLVLEAGELVEGDGRSVHPRLANGTLRVLQEPSFTRGDANADGTLDISDPIVVLEFLFLGGTESLACPDSADSDDSGDLDLSDAVVTLEFLFLGLEAPPEPFTACGKDPTADSLVCDAFPPCP